ncbi:MAG TPA: DUF3592 domain-containing protein [Pirellulales bacterium]|nr:DUF3592 domain-containing protein [Pirellulales bacterium]
MAGRRQPESLGSFGRTSVLARVVRRFFGKKRGARNMRSDKLGGASLGLFFAAVFLAGCIALGVCLVDVTIPDWRAKHKFVETTCQVLDKRILAEGESGGRRYRPDFHIRYQVGGQAYQVWTYEIPRLSTSDQPASKTILDAFQVGGRYPCWYDPFDPQQAVLAREYSLFAWMILILPGSFIAIGGGGLVYTLLNWGKSAERRSALAQRAAELDPFLEERAIAEKFPYVPGLENQTNSPGTRLAYRLPSAIPSWRLIGTLLLCLFWNGTVSVFIIIAVKSHADDNPEWFLTIALVPFCTIGVWLTALVVRQLLAMTGAGPTIVEIDRHPLRPGGRYRLFFAQSGRLAFESLSVSLVCDEEIVYRQGTNVRSESRRVYCGQVARHERFVIKPEKPFEAECEFEVPRTAMHSFKSEHNTICWKLLVSGDVVQWPPLERAYSVTVYPDLNAGLPS